MASQDLRKPLYENGEPQPKLVVDESSVSFSFQTPITDAQYAEALERMSRGVAARLGYTSAKITKEIHDTTTGGAHRGKGRGKVVRSPAPPHITLEVKSSHFPSSNTTLHVNVTLKTPNGGQNFEINALRRNDPNIYPSGYPYSDLRASAYTMVRDKQTPVAAYEDMYLKWEKSETKKARRRGRATGNSGDWPEEGGDPGAGTAGPSGPAGGGHDARSDPSHTFQDDSSTFSDPQGSSSSGDTTGGQHSCAAMGGSIPGTGHVGSAAHNSKYPGGAIYGSAPNPDLEFGLDPAGGLGYGHEYAGKAGYEQAGQVNYEYGGLAPPGYGHEEQLGYGTAQPGYVYSEQIGYRNGGQPGNWNGAQPEAGYAGQIGYRNGEQLEYGDTRLAGYNTQN
ncbi:hypothetical protein GQ53DRAFT_832968 [Thozetella sp. PMI_491]|nr:hypothetical protein GQ53DRAFT_832968 [Thozetella sp. PMI_491]